MTIEEIQAIETEIIQMRVRIEQLEEIAEADRIHCTTQEHRNAWYYAHVQKCRLAESLESFGVRAVYNTLAGKGKTR